MTTTTKPVRNEKKPSATRRHRFGNTIYNSGNTKNECGVSRDNINTCNKRSAVSANILTHDSFGANALCLTVTSGSHVAHSESKSATTTAQRGYIRQRHNRCGAHVNAGSRENKMLEKGSNSNVSAVNSSISSLQPEKQP